MTGDAGRTKITYATMTADRPSLPGARPALLV